jgi:glycosyltransferase involved in cell wall biosynthesis
MLTVGRDKPALGESRSIDGRTVAVIIPTYNHARFLGEAIESVLAQTRPVDEIIVVDDGSTDNPTAVVAQFPTVRLIRQDNRGPSAARNTGISKCKTSHIIFLGADDRLLPNALESGLACMATHPDCAFVYGGHRLISEDGHSLWCDIVRPIEGDGHLALLRRNLAGSPVAVLFRRDCLLAVNGFDESLRRCEDYDLYLRLASKYPIASYPTIVAEYRKHDQATSTDHVGMLKEALLVLDLDEARFTTEAHRAARREGRAHYRSHYVARILDGSAARWRAGRNIRILVRDLAQAARWSPGLTVRTLLGSVARRAAKAGRRAIRNSDGF